LRPLLSPRALKHLPAQANDMQADMALLVLQEQYAELEREYQNRHINDAQWQQARQEVERRALAEGLPAQVLLHSRPENAWALMSALFIATVAIAGYLFWGEPAAVIPANTIAA